jgi:hypothetical protein
MPEKRIERLDPALDRIIDTAETIHDLADGFGGDQGPAEGPLWWSMRLCAPRRSNSSRHDKWTSKCLFR